MPLIRSIDKLADGIRITRTTGQVSSMTSSDLPGTVTTTAAAETFVNNWITQQGWFGRCHVRAISPLDVDVVVADKAIPQTPGMFRA